MMSRYAKPSDLMSAITRSAESVRSASQRCQGAAGRRRHSAEMLALTIVASSASSPTPPAPPENPDATSTSSTSIESSNGDVNAAKRKAE